MEKLIERITGNTPASKLSGYGLLDKIVDAFATREKIRVIVSSPNYQELNILWGLITYNKGSKSEMLIEGGPRYCQAALRGRSDHSIGIHCK